MKIEVFRKLRGNTQGNITHYNKRQKGTELEGLSGKSYKRNCTKEKKHKRMGKKLIK